MKLKITVSARQFGYVIWNQKNGKEIEKLLNGRDGIHIVLNGFDLGMKKIDYRFHRISLGYRFTRALPEEHGVYSIKIDNDRMEVKTLNG